MISYELLPEPVEYCPLDIPMTSHCGVCGDLRYLSALELVRTGANAVALRCRAGWGCRVFTGRRRVEDEPERADLAVAEQAPRTWFTRAVATEVAQLRRLLTGGTK